MSGFYRIFFSFGIVLFLFFVPPTAQAQAVNLTNRPIDATDFFKLGVEDAKSGNYQKAFENFTQVIQLNDNFAMAYSNRCLVNLQLENYVKAAEDCAMALHLNPNNTEAYLNRGLAYYRLGNYLEAICEYEEVIKRNGNDFRAYYNRGLARFELNDYEGAIADYNQVLNQSHLHSALLADIYNDRGLAQLMLENVQDAIADFSLAISLNEENYRAFYNRACACHQNGDLFGAIRDFTLVLKLDPDYAEAYVNRGLLRHELGLQQAALSDLKMASRRFEEQGNSIAYQHTLAVIERLQQLIQLSNNAIA